MFAYLTFSKNLPPKLLKSQENLVLSTVGNQIALTCIKFININNKCNVLINTFNY